MNYRTVTGIVLMATIALSMTGVVLARNVPSSAHGSTNAGAANLPLGMNVIAAGGGAGSFSSVRAWDNMIGPTEVQSDLSSLARTYGQSETDRFVQLFTFVMADAWKRAGTDNLRMPAPSDESGFPLALAVVSAANTPQGEYRVQYLLGHLLTPRISSQVLVDLKEKYGTDAETQFVTMGNDFLDKVALQVGLPSAD